MDLNLTPDRIIPMVLWFVGLVGLHIAIGIYKQKAEKEHKEVPNDEDKAKAYTLSYWAFKLYPFLAVIFLLLMFGQ